MCIRDSEERFLKLKKNEENLNQLYIEIYGLQGELTSDENDRNVSIQKADMRRDTVSYTHLFHEGI